MDAAMHKLEGMIVGDEKDEGLEEESAGVHHQSFCERFCGSLICAFCIAPVIFLIGIFLLGWNEKRDVCDARAIEQGKNEVVTVQCDSATAGSGELVLFTCDLQQTGLEPLTLPNTDFSAMAYQGIGLKVETEMRQCHEKSSSTTTKKAGGGKDTTTTYTYELKWSSVLVNSANFARKNSDSFRQNCAGENPSSWPTGVPQPGKQMQPSVKAGDFTLEGEYIDGIPLATPVLSLAAPTGWTKTATGYESTRGRVTGSKGIGDVRTRFLGNDWNAPQVTVLGENSGGTIQRWTADDSWLCSGFTLAESESGRLSKDKLFKDLEASSSGTTVILRIVGFCLMWFALTRLAGPLEVAADCIPCVGPFLGDSIQAIWCCISCPPACACALVVIGIVWVVMRPAAGACMTLLGFCILGGYIGHRVYKKQQAEGEGKQPEEDPPPQSVGAPSSTE